MRFADEARTTPGGAVVRTPTAIFTQVLAREGLDLAFETREPPDRGHETKTLFATQLNAAGCEAIARACLQVLADHAPAALDDLADLAALDTAWLDARDWQQLRRGGANGYLQTVSDLAGVLPTGALDEVSAFVWGELAAWEKGENVAPGTPPPAFTPTGAIAPAWNETSYRAGFREGYLAALAGTSPYLPPVVHDAATTFADLGPLFDWEEQPNPLRGRADPVFTFSLGRCPAPTKEV